MSDPYSTPSNAIQPSSSGGLSPGILQALGGTKPWIRLCSVLGFIGSGFLLLAALVMLLAGGAIFASAGEGAVAGVMPVVLALVYVLMALIYFFPALKLWKYGSHILRLMNTQSMADLEAALDAQRSFWKFVGIMICAVLVLYVVLIIGAILFSAFAASAFMP